MNNVLIRKINEDKDYDCIYDICLAAWKPIYNHRKTIIDKKLFFYLYGDGEKQKATQVKKWCIENDEVVVAEIDDKVVGFMTWREHSDEVVEMCENAVAPNMQKKGIGSAMYDWFLNNMKNKYSYAFVFTGNDLEHEPARKAYQKQGFNMPLEYVRYYKVL